MKKKDPKTSKEGSIEESFGEVLKQIRQERRLSQEELAFQSGYHRTYISQLERGQKSPSLRTIFRLSKALGAEPSEILERVQKIMPPHS